MAKKNRKDDKKKLNYSEEVKLLRAGGPKRLYLLYGPEEYLREQFLILLRKLCLPEGEDSFSYKRINGPEPDPRELARAIDAMPFMSERSFVELRDVDINRLSEPEKYISAISDIPDYCTVVFVQGSSYEPDMRLKLMKAFKEHAYMMNFVPQSQGQLFSWVGRRFEAAGKSIGFEAVQRLIFVSGDLMNQLIPEIEKIAAYAPGETVSVADVDAVAHHIPDADIFTITDLIAKKDFNNAFSILNELLSDKSNEPVVILAVMGNQFRRLYAARLALDSGRDASELMEACSIKFEFIARNLMGSARGYTAGQLRAALELCARTDYEMKNSTVDNRELLRRLVLNIAAGV